MNVRFRWPICICGYILTTICYALPGTVRSQQRYNTCEIYQFLDADSSYLEKIAIQNFSGGHLAKKVSVAGLDERDSYSLCKRLRGTKIFKNGDTTKVQEIRRFYFVSSAYEYDNTGRLQLATRDDDDDGIHSTENDMYEYGQDGKLSRKYTFDVSHDLIMGVVINYYSYGSNGRIISDSSVSDHRAVLDYQWNEDNKRLQRLDTASMKLVTVYTPRNLQFRFDKEKDSVNRTITVKQYLYFDGGNEIQTSIHYWNKTEPESIDSIFTGKSGLPYKSITRYGNKRQLLKNYYYNKYGERARLVIYDSGEGYSGRITRLYTYLMKKNSDSRKR